MWVVLSDRPSFFRRLLFGITCLAKLFFKFKLGIFSKICDVIYIVIGKGKGKIKFHPIADHEGPEVE
jgi:hypothetical protein